MEELRAKKDDMMQTIYNMLCISLGKPPVKFDFEVKTPNGFVRDLGITPQSFFKKYVDMDLSQYISLINAPTSDTARPTPSRSLVTSQRVAPSSISTCPLKT